VISKKALRDCWLKHPETEQPLKAWYREMCLARWSTPNQLKADFPSASILQEGRVVFNIKGNQFRVIVKINFSFQLIWIRFVGMHVEYDKIDAQNI
jgi:mRNA interferase HigB